MKPTEYTYKDKATWVYNNLLDAFTNDERQDKRKETRNTRKNQRQGRRDIATTGPEGTPRMSQPQFKQDRQAVFDENVEAFEKKASRKAKAEGGIALEALETIEVLIANGKIEAALQEEIKKEKDDSKKNNLQTLLERIQSGEIDATNIREDMGKRKGREKKVEGNKKRKSLLKGGQGTTNPLPPTRKQKANQAMYGLENMASSYINPYSDPTRSLLGTVGRLQVGNKAVDPNALNLLHNANNTLDKIVSGTVGALIPGGSTPLRDLIERRRARQSSGQDAYDENVEALSRSDERSDMAEGGDIDAQMETLMPTEGTHIMPDGTEMPGATHEEYEDTMSTDEDMEDGYLDFILDEALEDEEETYLMEQLESNDKLSLIFDKVIDVATEFAGSGPVEGPGSGVSDSIPARLSDGEFVFTAKATEELGADNLEAIMREAETQADGRQELNLGGKPIKEEEMAVDQYGKPIDSNIVDDEIRKGMLSTNPRLK